MKTLYLPVRRHWFQEIKAGTKTHEYRLRTDFWAKRIPGKHYDIVVITLGYPPRSDESRRLEFGYDSYSEATITSKEFGGRPAPVYAISLRGEPLNPTAIQATTKWPQTIPPQLHQLPA